jgi:hypothetical protein
MTRVPMTARPPKGVDMSACSRLRRRSIIRPAPIPKGTRIAKKPSRRHPARSPFGPMKTPRTANLQFTVLIILGRGDLCKRVVKFRRCILPSERSEGPMQFAGCASAAASCIGPASRNSAGLRMTSRLERGGVPEGPAWQSLFRTLHHYLMHG